MRLLALTACLLACGPAPADAPRYRYPGHLNPYDFATPEDQFLSRQLAPFLAGDRPSQWTLFADLKSQLGSWVTQYLDAQQIASLITDSLPLDGQDALKPLDDLVADCAKVLRMDKPDVLVRNSPHTAAYPAEAGGRTFLVLTSGLLRLYDGKPEELRFVVGRELAHLKAKHLRLHAAAYGVVSACQRIDLKVVPEDYQRALPTLALGWVCSWARESEVTADRGGLLCCQDFRVAADALARLLSGLDAKSGWVDPKAPHFNADAIVRQFERWQNEPFVAFVTRVKRFSRESPFIPERIAALKLWSESEQYRAVLARTRAGEPDAGQTVTVKRVRATELAPDGATADAYVIAYQGDKELFRTIVSYGTREAIWADIPLKFPCRDGEPVFFEVWDRYRFRPDVFIGGFVVHPVNPANDPRAGKTEYTAGIDWNWKGRTDTTRRGLAEVTVEFGRGDE